jgi:hypothetical protein
MSILRPSELGVSDRVAISCTQTHQPAAQQRAIVREWRDVLPELPGVRLVWLTSRTPQDLFDAACRVPELDGLYVKWSAITHLDAIVHARSLRYLHLGSSARLESIVPLDSCSRLEVLGLEELHLAQWWDEDEVAELRRLNVRLGSARRSRPTI